MSRTVKIPLKNPIMDHSGPVREIVIREPTFDEYLSLGEPYSVAESKDGSRFAVENADVVKSYLAICLVKPGDPGLLAAAGISVARKVRHEILGFFQDGDVAESASKASPTTSPSTTSAASTSEQSAA